MLLTDDAVVMTSSRRGESALKSRESNSCSINFLRPKLSNGSFYKHDCLADGHAVVLF